MIIDGLRGSALIDKINNQKEEVIKEMMTSYGDKIMRLCFVQLGDEHEAEDATQEVFLKAYKYMSSYKGQSSVYTWLYKIAINTCFDILKKRSKFKIQDISLYTSVLRSDKETEDIIFENITSKSIREGLMKIPEKYRILLYMFYYEELKVVEIAEILNEKENTIKTRLKRGRVALKKYIEKEEV